jgi:predicted nucleotidyltransferase
MTITELIECLRQHVPAILDGYPINLAYLYGSAARSRATPLSDIDIALLANVELAPEQRLRLMLDVALAIEERCNLQEVDVRVINDAPLLLQGQVVTEGILLYARDEATRICFEVDTRMRYFDYLPVYERYMAEFLDNVRQKGLFYGQSPTH